jgi:hypothetical protein
VLNLWPFAFVTDAQLKGKTEFFRQRLKAGETLDDIQAEAFAVVREAAKRTLGMSHFDVQVRNTFVRICRVRAPCVSWTQPNLNISRCMIALHARRALWMSHIGVHSPLQLARPEACLEEGGSLVSWMDAESIDWPLSCY